MGSMLDLTEAVDFVSSTGILSVCDFLVLGTLVFYIVWFNLNARSRFSDEDCSGREPLVQQAYYLKKDWCRGSLIFAGWHRVTQGASLIFSLMVLVDMAYANLVSPVEITGRVVIYIAASLIFGVSGAMFRFSVLADAYRRAYIAVNDAILQYEASADLSSEEKLSLLQRGVSKGEELISQLDPL